MQCEVSKRLQSSSRIVTNGYIDSPSARSRSKCKDLGTSQKVTDHPQLSPKLLKLRKQVGSMSSNSSVMCIVSKCAPAGRAVEEGKGHPSDRGIVMSVFVVWVFCLF